MEKYKTQTKMQKYEIRDYGNGVFEIVIAMWVNTIKPHYIEALIELGKDYYIMDVRQMGLWQQHFVVTTMPKMEVK